MTIGAALGTTNASMETYFTVVILPDNSVKTGLLPFGMNRSVPHSILTPNSGLFSPSPISPLSLVEVSTCLVHLTRIFSPS